MPDTTFDFFKYMFSEEEAQAYIEMPYGVVFTAVDFAAESGRDEADCLAICEDLSKRGLLWRSRRAGGAVFHQLPVAHGMFEYNLNHFYDEGFKDAFNTVFTFGLNDYNAHSSGSPLYYAIPCDRSVVSDGEILIHDDIEKLIERSTIIGVSPCQCRMYRMVNLGQEAPPLFSEELKDFMDPTCGHPLETCMSFGEEAEYYIENGIAREIDKDEARAIVQRSVDAGMVLNSSYAKEASIICHCHGDCCGILGSYQRFIAEYGTDAMAEVSCWPNVSRYQLDWDKEACIKCGACVAQCTMFAVTIGEDGYPETAKSCVKCGQCGMTCPVQARTLSALPADQVLELNDGVNDDQNQKAAYRFESGLIF
jgi:ferredoxin